MRRRKPGQIYFQASFTTDGERRYVLAAVRSVLYRIPRIVPTPGGWALHIGYAHVSVRKWNHDPKRLP